MIALIAAAILAMAPAKPYVHVDQPVTVQFMQSDQATAQHELDVVGLKALQLGAFKPASVADLVDQNGLPEFAVYTFAGKPLTPTAVAKTDLASGQVNVAQFYPGISAVGTYILTWKSAQPLVIETLQNPGGQPPGPVVLHIEPLQYAVISTADGDMKALFYYDAAPNTVDNFIKLSAQGFYDDSAFHRIIKGFMIQGGDPNARTDRAGTGGPGYQINAELNSRPHERGVLSMARSQNINSAGSQFFVVHQNGPSADYLNGKYTAFGKLFDGLDTLDKIADTPNDGDNGSVAIDLRPLIKTIRILPATAAIYGINPGDK